MTDQRVYEEGTILRVVEAVPYYKDPEGALRLYKGECKKGHLTSVSDLGLTDEDMPNTADADGFLIHPDCVEVVDENVSPLVVHDDDREGCEDKLTLTDKTPGGEHRTHLHYVSGIEEVLTITVESPDMDVPVQFAYTAHEAKVIAAFLESAIARSEED